MKFKVFTLLVLLSMLLGLAACGEKATPTTTTTATMASEPLPAKGIREKATPTTTATATEQRQIVAPTEAAPPPLSDLEKLLIDVFAPQPGEKVLVMSDLPHGKWTDNERWADRREMAIEWHSAFQQLGTN